MSAFTGYTEHDDGAREYDYQSVAGSFESDEPVTTTARRKGWTTISMRNDWDTIYADA